MLVCFIYRTEMYIFLFKSINVWKCDLKALFQALIAEVWHMYSKNDFTAGKSITSSVNGENVMLVLWD